MIATLFSVSADDFDGIHLLDLEQRQRAAQDRRHDEADRDGDAVCKSHDGRDSVRQERRHGCGEAEADCDADERDDRQLGDLNVGDGAHRHADRLQDAELSQLLQGEDVEEDAQDRGRGHEEHPRDHLQREVLGLVAGDLVDDLLAVGGRQVAGKGALLNLIRGDDRLGLPLVVRDGHRAHGCESLRADEADVAVSVVRPLGEGDDRKLLLRDLVDHPIADVDALVLERAVEDDLVVPKIGNSQVGVDEGRLEGVGLVVIRREVRDVQGVRVVDPGDSRALDDEARVVAHAGRFEGLDVVGGDRRIGDDAIGVRRQHVGEGTIVRDLRGHGGGEAVGEAREEYDHEHERGDQELNKNELLWLICNFVPRYFHGFAPMRAKVCQFATFCARKRLATVPRTL